MSSDTGNSPAWSTPAKALFALTGIVLVGGLVIRFQALIPILVLAAILAFLVVPVVRTLHTRAKMPWALAANLCFLIVVLLIIGVSTATGLAVIQQLQALFLTVQRFLADLPALLSNISQQTYVVGPWTLDFSQYDLAPLGEQLLASVQPVLGQLSSFLASLATGAIESLARLIFVLAVGYFLTVDYNRIRTAVRNISIPGYSEDFLRLRIALVRIWNAFLRGQLLVVATTGVLTWIVISALGVRFSLGLGVLGGLAKFVPILGPITAGLVAALVALFQPANWLGVSPFGHAVLVVVCIFFLDQAIDYLVVPRIMGTSLNLHPVVILIGLLIGASLAGILGLLLSAPTMASMVLLGRYTYRKMPDTNPCDPPIDAMHEGEIPESRLVRLLRRVKELRQETERGSFGDN